MALPNVADARKLSDEELSTEITTAKQKLFELRMQRATRRLEKTHEFKHMRHWIAQLLTVERERQIAAEKASPEQGTEPVVAETTSAAPTTEEE